MPFKEKAIVRHRLRPDWGAGRVMNRSDEYLQIDFTAGGLIKLKTSIADDHLEAASDEEARALKPPKVKAKRVVAAAAAVAVEAPKAGLGPKGIVPAKGLVPPAKGLVAPAKGSAPAKAVAPAKSAAPAKSVAPVKSAAPAKSAPAKKAAPAKVAAKSGAVKGKSAPAKSPARTAPKSIAKAKAKK